MPIYAIDGSAPDFADEASAFVAPDATVIGNVSVGRDVSDLVRRRDPRRQ